MHAYLLVVERSSSSFMQAMTSCLMYVLSRSLSESRTCCGGPPGASVSVRPLLALGRCKRSGRRSGSGAGLLLRLARPAVYRRDGERLDDRLKSAGCGAGGGDLDGGDVGRLMAAGRAGGGGGGSNSLFWEGGGGTACKLFTAVFFVCMSSSAAVRGAPLSCDPPCSQLPSRRAVDVEDLDLRRGR